MTIKDINRKIITDICENVIYLYNPNNKDFIQGLINKRLENRPATDFFVQSLLNIQRYKLTNSNILFLLQDDIIKLEKEENTIAIIYNIIENIEGYYERINAYYRLIILLLKKKIYKPIYFILSTYPEIVETSNFYLLELILEKNVIILFKKAIDAYIKQDIKNKSIYFNQERQLFTATFTRYLLNKSNSLFKEKNCFKSILLDEKYFIQ